MCYAMVAAAGSLVLDWSLKEPNLENNEFWE